MLAQLRLNKKILITLFFPMSVYAQSVELLTLENDRSSSSHHGLYEVNEDIKKFLHAENEKNNGYWEALEPNLKYILPLCIVPLKISWVPKKYGLSGPGVFVDCSKSTATNNKKWQIVVPVYDASNLKKKH